MAHFDIHAWTPKAKPGRPKGAEVQAARLLYDLIDTRYRTGAGRAAETKVHKIIGRVNGPS